MAQNKPSQSEIDGVQYRRAKLWQIIMVASNGLVSMGFYSLIGMASYSASIGFGIATVAVGGILTFTRIFDAVTDPMLAFIYDKVNTRFGKIRVLLASGWLIMVLASGKEFISRLKALTGGGKTYFNRFFTLPIKHSFYILSGIGLFGGNLIKSP